MYLSTLVRVNNMQSYILPVENSHGGDSWKMPIIFSAPIDLSEIKKKDIGKFIKIMLLTFQKAYRENTSSCTFISIGLHTLETNSKLQPDFWNYGQAIATEHLEYNERIELSLIDEHNVSFEVKEPKEIESNLLSSIAEHVHFIQITAQDLSIIEDDF